MYRRYNTTGPARDPRKTRDTQSFEYSATIQQWPISTDQPTGWPLDHVTLHDAVPGGASIASSIGHTHTSLRTYFHANHKLIHCTPRYASRCSSSMLITWLLCALFLYKSFLWLQICNMSPTISLARILLLFICQTAIHLLNVTARNCWGCLRCLSRLHIRRNEVHFPLESRGVRRKCNDMAIHLFIILRDFLSNLFWFILHPLTSSVSYWSTAYEKWTTKDIGISFGKSHFSIFT